MYASIVISSRNKPHLRPPASSVACGFQDYWVFSHPKRGRECERMEKSEDDWGTERKDLCTFIRSSIYPSIVCWCAVLCIFAVIVMLLHFETWNMFLFLFECLPFSLLRLFLIYIYNINLWLLFTTSTVEIIPKRILFGAVAAVEIVVVCLCCGNEWTHWTSMRVCCVKRWDEMRYESMREQQRQTSASNHNVFKWWSFIFPLTNVSIFLRYIETKLCIQNHGLFRSLLFWCACVRACVYGSVFVISLNSHTYSCVRMRVGI